MREIPVFRLSAILAMLAGVATVLGLLIYNSFAWMYGVSDIAIFVISVIVGIVTFVISLTGLRLHRTYNYNRKKATIVGAVFGTIAFFFSVFMTMVIIFYPKNYNDVLSIAMPTGFVLGGFLGPMIGAIVGYKLSDPTTKSRR